MPGLPTVKIRDGGLDFWASLGLAVVTAVVMAFLLHYLIFRPLRHAPPLARAVASVGVMLVLQAAALLRYGTTRRLPGPILPTRAVTLGSLRLGEDRLLLAIGVVVLTGGLTLLYRKSYFGIATAAAATGERTAVVLGISADRIALLNWLLACLIACFAGILISPLAGVDNVNYTLLVVPALGAVLIARFQVFWIATAAALCIGCLQSLMTKVQTLPAVPQWAHSGLQDALPFVVIVGVLWWGADRIPTRGSVVTTRLPAVPRRPGSPFGGLAIFVIGTGAVALSSGSARLATIESGIAIVLLLSVVLLTGYVGQISLVQASFAGAAGFASARLATSLHLPIPLADIAGLLVAVGFGLLIALPALRVRGVQLAVVTLGASVAIETLIFQNPAVVNADGTIKVSPFRYFGLDLDAGSGAQFPRLRFGIVVMASAAVLFVAVGRLRRHGLGKRMLAVRANERSAAAAGVNVAATKLVAFALSAAIAGWAGILTAHLRSELSFDSFGVFVSLNVLALAYLGGIARPTGAVVGALLTGGGVITYFLNDAVNFGRYAFLVAGLGLIISAVRNPEGIAGGVANMLQVRRRRVERSKAADVESSAAPRTAADGIRVADAVR